MENHNFENEGQFQRKMTSRHLFMLSLGGVIGTGCCVFGDAILR